MQIGGKPDPSTFACDVVNWPLQRRFRMYLSLKRFSSVSLHFFSSIASVSTLTSPLVKVKVESVEVARQ